jgi:hypothetical protein
MPGKIFINYRREDSIAIAGRLYDRLAEAFGRNNLFIDVDNIPVGMNFEEYLHKQVAACDVVVSLIGPNWLNAKDETNQRRLDQPDDFVAIEIAAALARNILVIPVLVDGTHMPKASELPDSLKPLALRNAIQVRNTNFGSDVGQLIIKMREALALGRSEQTQNPLVAYLVAAFLLNIAVFLMALSLGFHSLSDNYADYGRGWAAAGAALLFFVPGFGALFRDKRKHIRMWGLVSAVGGLLAVAAIKFFFIGIGPFDPAVVQSATSGFVVPFIVSAIFFGSDRLSAMFFYYSLGPVQQRKSPDTETTLPEYAKTALAIIKWIFTSPWTTGFIFLCGVIYMEEPWKILYRVTESTAAVVALIGVQVLVTGFCFVRYRKALAANSWPVAS